MLLLATNTEFQYTPEELEKIVELRNLVESNANLEIGTENVFLSKFLSYSSWNVQHAYEAILKYYAHKHKHPDWMARHSVKHYREHFHSLQSKFLMRKTDKFGRAIFVMKTVDAFNKYPDYFHDIIEMDDLIFESLLTLPQVQKNGIVLIHDLHGTTKNFLKMASPPIAKLINAKNEILPFSTLLINIIQKGFLMNMLTNLLLPFMAKETKEKIVIHDGKNYDKLRDIVGYENLPAEYGGPKENVCDMNFTYDFLLQNEEYLLKLQGYKMKDQ